MIDTLLNHRSIRKYKPKAIPNEILEKVLLAGTRASTTGNMQVYSMVVTSKPEIKEKLWEAHFNFWAKTKTVSDIGIFARIQNFWNLLRGSSDFTLSFSFYPEISFLILNNNIYNIEGK
jgi:FMN reductase (NADPH)